MDSNGVRPDPNKVRAIQDMKQPTSVKEIRRFLGMVNQLSKFSPQLADKTKPLRYLLNLKNQWMWGEAQKQAFGEVKRILSSSEVLALYSPERETMVSADASSYGLGAVIQQKQPDGHFGPISYIKSTYSNRTKICTNQKGGLGSDSGMESFQHYILGLHFKMETDH